ncbi:Spo0B domain-containing protein [Lentibacillus sp.]|uniref:Spo0B domain-containing protein n=1 Tax=Lentibacillus sp. TaxID=1925746 RepID=UPI002B4AB049|nr:Spo0B domain-containing protein [Lentibacillus sp.]HLS07559.1 Spo0B domain-containing protein [Lentibacillus sp.]
MEEKDVIQLLRHYRHDLMNHLQIVQGYLSMGNTEKAQTKLKTYMEQLQEESKLVNLNAPAFALYIQQFNFLHTNFRLTYHIHTANKNLQSLDYLLAECCKKVVETIVEASDKKELYELDVHISDVELDMIELEFAVSGRFSDEKTLIKHLKNMDWNITVACRDETLTCTVNIPNK